MSTLALLVVGEVPGVLRFQALMWKKSQQTWDVVYDFGPEEAEERLEAWCATGGDGIVGEWSRAELEEHVRDEHSTFT